MCYLEVGVWLKLHIRDVRALEGDCLNWLRTDCNLGENVGWKD